tara:strand:- start:272 stop:532 length:261 start_codon:yes stop_codon:yes gene_type:complete
MTARGAFMRCKYCDKETVFNTSVCHQHGGHRIRYGSEAPNFKNGSRTKETIETRRRLRLLNHLGNLGGFIKRKLRGRKILIQGEKI